MSPNKSKHHQNEHHQVLGELKAIDRAVARISTIVDGLDEKIDKLSTAQKQAAAANVEQPEPQPIATIAPTLPPLFAEYGPVSLSPAPPNPRSEHNYYARLHNSLGEDGDYVLMPLRDKSNRPVSSFPRTLGRLAFIYGRCPLLSPLTR